TIAAMTLASGQMGPRVLRNFTRDPGTGISLGIFIGTFVYCLVVVRAAARPDFRPGLATSVGVGLGFLCVATLIYFVHHAATMINVQYVISRVAPELRASLAGANVPRERDEVPSPPTDSAAKIGALRSGYIAEIEEERLVHAAARHEARITLKYRPGDFVLADADLALVEPPEIETRLARAIHRAVRLHPRRSTTQDPEYAIRQLVEIGVRALSSGINDPFTAADVLDRLGEGLAILARQELFDGVYRDRDGEIRLVRPASDYQGLVDAMFLQMRQDGKGSPAITIRILEILTHALETEKRTDRRAVLAHHAEMTLDSGRSAGYDPHDLADLEQRYRAFRAEYGRLPVQHGRRARTTRSMPDRSRVVSTSRHPWRASMSPTLVACV
ncbi:DUF2254 domain-containing protein, partial [bacterium]